TPSAESTPHTVADQNLDAVGAETPPAESTPHTGADQNLDAVGAETPPAESTPHTGADQNLDAVGTEMPPAESTPHTGAGKNQDVTTIPKTSLSATPKGRNSRIDRTSKGAADRSRENNIDNVQTTLYTLFVDGEISRRELSVLNLIYKMGGNDTFVPLSAADIMKKLDQKSATWVPGVIKSLETKQKIKKMVGSASTKNSFMLSL
ncbi:MAG: hypothetical protein M3Q07_28020, partial [Pseudobdellovibrionaceae bacterium]|nr:hypothetical protein [Pseudobdellovibrionaceae bacterium]